MRGYVDLHCHWVADIDDGARTLADSAAMLTGLHEAGFDVVVATPHMRPGLFDNSRADIEAAFARTRAALPASPALPAVALASEHYLDDLVFERLMGGAALPYPAGHAALIEFPADMFPLRASACFYELRVKRRIRPVLAHPERYRPVWKDITVLDPLLDGGAVLLLDLGSLVGKYGRQARRAAHELLEAGCYHAACSDAHRPGDVAQVAAAIRKLHELEGPEEAEFLLGEGPRSILEGRVET
ncbi:MAG: protein tyrosine phosphatase [Polyangiaceae bacterium]|nr:protein tyrosine phosphatase [Polyangiaceae bacterium]